jgi:putative membrane protein
MKKLIIPVCLAAILGIGVGCNGNESTESTTATSDSVGATTTNDRSATTQTTDRDTSMADDREFAMEAASGGLMEVALGKLAETNASSAKVKEFGRMMVTDHTKANTELKALAARKNITIPTTPTEHHQKHIDELKTKKGSDFDKAYVDMMVDDHKEDVDNFEEEVKDGNDADLKAFASKTLPVLNKHLTSIKAIQDGMKK